MKTQKVIDSIFDFCQKSEDKYVDLAAQAMDKNNMIGNVIYNSEANAYTKVRWFLEGILEKERTKDMEFNVAYNLMKKGAKIKLPEWEGYWYWDEKKNTIMIHTKEGKELDIRESEDMDFTMKNICREDWIEAN